ncbi:TadE/TadG family type IV pilus assembly protein [Bacillus sp. DTU_2020_1000418_1_SI_GHA_SEK_038]|uniref:TadE/TadG family type IV pilus assembly protein n=1 Tax=Bacillus sp. DTU_2020_1000418_1_SI_GHA_SEK_038 TaxID=3077585 RepID=UPI0028E1B11B|nr:TadE/TadG family type IV pilus assembly protein [Bacillus sp. DTU_2020_1000418_1_SI_GHA_SEK_038]WNS75996.1 TadE/TadG family type IV pilus assembly protein [Bacillus sp. DTU_2020_1000418_1_SI_GHA_SEK_038]
MRIFFKRYVKNERGSQAIEFVAMFPLVILGFLIIWQIALIAFSLVVAESAARDGARAAAIHDPDWKKVAERSASGFKPVVRGGPGEKEARVEVYIKAPVIALPFIADMEFEFTADAVMPMEEDPDETD